MIHIGIVGLGFMGMIHYLAAQQARGPQGRRSVQPRCQEAGGRLDEHSRAILGPAVRIWTSLG